MHVTCNNQKDFGKHLADLNIRIHSSNKNGFNMLMEKNKGRKNDLQPEKSVTLIQQQEILKETCSPKCSEGFNYYSIFCEREKKQFRCIDL